ncbi:DsbC family protein [Caldimonas brevitalea]|uniref:Thiol:disulfide interchange protein n=1 Tax=Caldimonas brevitalea TaxID=413882 RepID=A0A0G3BUX3_9BURK|nr:DsbC family protein [Caldimonas brevitalea]AKJ31191.1 disulfide isomerase [Caldimonas brevitalea]
MKLRRVATAALLTLIASAGVAQEAVIRKNLAERLPNLPKIDEVSKAPVDGLYEVRFGTDIVYTDAEGNFLIQGEIIDARVRKNLTEERINKLTAIDFASLPLKDAIVWKNGTGKRKIAVFADPNCGYCKRFEQDLQAVKDVTVYTFLYPILAADSAAKSDAIWCSKDRTKAWLDWMLRSVQPAPAPEGCQTPVARNSALGRKHRVTGTPALVFEDGTRVPGAMNTEQIEQQLTAVAQAKR